MRDRRLIAFWAVTVGFLFFLEIAEITHLFQVPLISAISNLVAFVFALVFTTILALIGALFIGIYISQRLQSGGGFTEFEEEMLRMRADVQRLANELAEIRRSLPSPPRDPDPPKEKRRA